MKAYTVKRRITLTVEAGSIVVLDERQASRNALSLEEKSVRKEETSSDESETKTKRRAKKED